MQARPVAQVVRNPNAGPATYARCRRCSAPTGATPHVLARMITGRAFGDVPDRADRHENRRYARQSAGARVVRAACRSG
jgi:hypothetical protein